MSAAHAIIAALTERIRAIIVSSKALQAKGYAAYAPSDSLASEVCTISDSTVAES